MKSDAFGRAIHDYQRGKMDEPLIQRDGKEAREHPVEENYFGELDPTAGKRGGWRVSWLDGPLLDMGAGAGRDTVYFQDHFETVAIEVSEHLVETMRERGVNDARYADMFALRKTFERDRFQSALAIGTQLGLAGSMQGLRQFLGDLAFVTTSDATAVLDGFDPEEEESANMLGYRADPTTGLAYRVMHFEYECDVDKTLLFRLFSPDRVQEAVVGTEWDVAKISRPTNTYRPHYQVALSKS
ncbi:methyltransferase domain-containing protein [Halococcus sediminicola]|uniref:class I SAM-dependent methyltransferase n=1 Tax=Halococcus sediminicola TaxID=1264579 RepID=UPI000678AA44|nr:class I SAM-dependent methyltransferase [Halococcus sediminicola]